MRILIVKISALGDVVHALPVLSYLTQVSPGIEIDWVVEEGFAPVLEDNPRLSLVIPVALRRWRKGPLSRRTVQEILSVRRLLSGRRYDIVFDIQGNIKSGIVSWFTGCHRRYGFDEGGVRESPNLWFTTNHVPLRKGDYHVTDRALRVVSTPFGRDFREMELTTEIVTTPEEDEAAAVYRATVGDGPVILIHQGTTWETKQWHEEGWIALCRRLVATYPDAAFLFSWGNEPERGSCERIIRGVGRGGRLLPSLSLKGFVSFLKQADLVVGPDTGPVHLAAAVGTPTVSLFRATDGRRNAPRGRRHRFIQSSLPCSGCLEKTCADERRCHESVSADAVAEACIELLGG